MKINYVIGAWGGPRQDYPRGEMFIQTHLEKLQTLQHGLSTVTVGYPLCNAERPDYTAFMRAIETSGQLRDGTPVTVLRTPNKSGSYGQWEQAFMKYRKAYDYYIFVEDDYIPVLAHFDRVLVDMHQRLKAGYLCGLIFDDSGRYGTHHGVKHGAISNGIVSVDCLEAIYARHGCLPTSDTAGNPPQAVFTHAPLTVGFSIEEYISSGEYRAVYWDHTELLIYGPSRDGKDIFIPVQYEEGADSRSYRHIKDWETWPPTNRH